MLRVPTDKISLLPHRNHNKLNHLLRIQEPSRSPIEVADAPDRSQRLKSFNEPPIIAIDTERDGKTHVEGKSIVYVQIDSSPHRHRDALSTHDQLPLIHCSYQPRHHYLYPMCGVLFEGTHSS